MEQTLSAKKPVIFSGIQPTGGFTLGNYMGALRNWVAMQEEYDCIYCVVDLHSLTVRQDPRELRENTLRAYALLIACGIDPEKSVLFMQSHVHTHAELSWLLNCYTPYGELGRMTQFKDKSSAHSDNVNAGLFTYPALMAADILAYQAGLVPVGADQKQHLELARNLALRFNGLYGDTFRVPEPYIPKEGGRIMSLADPARKMSKSDQNPKAYVAILDEPDVIRKKFRAAVTDSEARVECREGKDGIVNLMTIYSLATGKNFDTIEREFEGRGYGDFKAAVGDAVADHLAPIREQYLRLTASKDYLRQCYRDGAEKALARSQKTLEKAYKKVGLLAR